MIHKRSAFTLIELLVVMAIVVILASLVIAAVGTAQDNARATKCLANLREIGKGVILYLNDNNDDFFATGGTTSTWPTTLHDKYGITWKQFRSPFDRVTGQRPDRDSGNSIPVSYGLNASCFDTNTGKWTATGSLIIGAPALGGGSQISFDGTSGQNVMINRPAGGANSKLGTHKNRSFINALFGDGRVESMTYGTFATTSGEEGQRRWNPLAPVND
jgi:prepilin-type N-terminal cleavage/methylation domain-containing protein/prepilin-type processing-associated H-X9-DG protein